MAFKVIFLTACFAALSYAAPPLYAPAPVAYAAAPVVKAYAPAPVAYAAAPVVKAYAPAPVAYHAPVAPVAYPAPAAYAAPVKAYAPVAVDTEYDPNPSYSYAYDIKDSLTGDYKSQHESRQGDVVQGSYSLVEPDGSTRTVEYTADPHNGFNAVVHKDAAVVKAAPVVAKYAAAPVAYAPAYAAKVAAVPVYHK
ncbi:cuticle protein 7-like [Diaphorina citri]|uniref:Cuticle protein 7-like n=1 Tax=Diaphorina citri TaxID=121845 RepID=A0A1S3DIR9_DIACI|nr:cuticle protein 7-like [Diaphorina citri]